MAHSCTEQTDIAPNVKSPFLKNRFTQIPLSLYTQMYSVRALKIHIVIVVQQMPIYILFFLNKEPRILS